MGLRKVNTIGIRQAHKVMLLAAVTYPKGIPMG